MRTTMTGIGDPPLIFVHGFACDGTDWQAQRESLEKKTTVIVCELPGHGFSPGTSAECTIEAYGAAVAKTLRELPSRPAILVGHSMGCRVVLEANRVQSDAVAGLVLVDGSRISSGDPIAAEQAMADELAGDGYRRFVRQFFESMFFPSSNPALAMAIVERALRFPTGLGRTLMTDLAGWDAREMESALDSVHVPLLAIQSTTLDTARQRVSLEPGLSSPWLELVSAHVPQASIEMLHGYSHFPQIELADEVTALIADCAWPASHRYVRGRA
jgi:pimeloyl-ACP methyl ester carboxylesterase